MPEKLKDMFYDTAFIDQLSAALLQAYPAFDPGAFRAYLEAGDLDNLELKAKMRLVTQALRATLPHDYAQALAILREVAPGFQGFNAMVFPDFVECYGLDDWERSLPALAEFTSLCSSELAVRPFLHQDPKRALPYLLAWAQSEDEHLRRLASEGCRPRLPWAMALPAFKQDPTPILPILEKLKRDPAEYVRRSVANNLNDISKDHPKLVLEIAERWYGHAPETDWIVKHACRGLLKAGHPRAMRLFGFGDPANLHVKNLALSAESLVIGQEVIFSFDLLVPPPAAYKVRLEYKVYYLKANGKHSPKVFQIGESRREPGRHTVRKKHSFRPRSTRVHYPGEHHLAIIVNGVEKARATLRLWGEDV